MSESFQLQKARSDLAARRFRATILALEYARKDAWSRQDLQLMRDVLAVAEECRTSASGIKSGIKGAAVYLRLRNLIWVVQSNCEMIAQTKRTQPGEAVDAPPDAPLAGESGRAAHQLARQTASTAGQNTADIERRLARLSIEIKEARRQASARYERLEHEIADLRAALATPGDTPVDEPARALQAEPVEPRVTTRPTPEPVAPVDPPARTQAPEPAREATLGPSPTPPGARLDAPVAEPTAERAPSLVAVLLERLAGVEFSDLLGARALAWTGAVVSMLGIALLFALGIDRGWITPEVRIALGAFASTVGIGLGIWLHRRFGEFYAGLAAAGAGIAGAYGTLLSATALYDFIPPVVALACAAVIAGVGVWLAVAWASQMVAGLGLIGAMASAPVIQQDVSVLGGAFIALVTAASLAVAIHQKWRELLIIAGAVSAGEISYVLASAEASSQWRLVALTSVFWLIYTGAGIGYQLRSRDSALRPLAAAFVLAGISLAGAGSAVLLEGSSSGLHEQGMSLLVIALLQGAIGASIMVRRGPRDLATLMWVTALVVSAVAVGLLLTGTWLTLVWAAMAAALAWLAVRTDEGRFQAAAAVYLGLTAGHALVIEAVPDQLFIAQEHPASGAISVAFTVAAAIAFAYFTQQRTPTSQPDTTTDPTPAAWLDQRQTLWHQTTLWLATALTIYATSLTILEIAQTVGTADLETKFQRGHAGVSAFWGLVGIALLYLGLVENSRAMRLTGFAWFGVLIAKIFIYDLRELGSVARALSFLAVGALLLVGAFVYQRLTRGFDGRDRRARSHRP